MYSSAPNPLIGSTSSPKVKVKELTLSQSHIQSPHFIPPPSPTSVNFYWSLNLIWLTWFLRCCLDTSSTLSTQGLCCILFLENVCLQISAQLDFSSFKFLVQMSLYVTRLSQLPSTKYQHSATSSPLPPTPLILLNLSLQH